MNDKQKMIICICGLILSTQIQWIIPDSEIFNGLGCLFGIGFGWYAREAMWIKQLKETKKK